MLTWLKELLGESYSEEIDKKVEKQIGKEYVPKSDLDVLGEVKTQLEKEVETRDKQIEKLKKIDPEKLQEQITQLQEQNAQDKAAYEAKLKETQINNAVEKSLLTSKAKNIKAVRALLDLENAELLEDGSIKGLTEQIEALQKAKDSAFLFENPKEAPVLQGLKPGESNVNVPTQTVDFSKMSYSEICAYMEANPEATM